jgi:queuosine precursor transporter
MFNELFGLGFLLIHFTLVMAAYKMFGKLGLFVWIGVASVLANIQVLQGIELFSLQATLGNTLYGSIFLATDILVEKYGKKSAQGSVYIGFFSIIVFMITMNLALWFTPLNDEFALLVHDAFSLIFGFSGRIVLGSLVAYFISQSIDIRLYSWIKSKFPSDKFLWLRNNGSTLISQWVDTAIFVLIAFLGTPYSLIEIMITTYVLKAIIALLDTPFVYLAKKITPLNFVE